MVSDHRRYRGRWLLLEPGEIRLATRKETSEGIDEHRISRLAQLTAGLPQRQAALDPTVALVTASPLRALSPKDAKAQRRFCTLCSCAKRIDKWYSPDYVAWEMIILS